VAEAGLAHTTAEVDACCHAVQDKAWVAAPDVPLGAWEFYTVLADDDPATEQASTGTCCASGTADATPCCAGSAEDA